MSDKTRQRNAITASKQPLASGPAGMRQLATVLRGLDVWRDQFRWTYLLGFGKPTSKNYECFKEEAKIERGYQGFFGCAIGVAHFLWPEQTDESSYKLGCLLGLNKTEVNFIFHNFSSFGTSPSEVAARLEQVAEAQIGHTG